MKAISDFFVEIGHLIGTAQVTDFLDILLVTFLIYKVISMIRSSSTARIGKAVVMLILLFWITGVFKLHVLHYMLDKVLELGLLSLVILFQPELRRAVERMGSTSIKEMLTPRQKTKEITNVIAQVVTACEIMARERVGALMVFERTSRLDEYFKTGTVIDGRVSEQLIRNIFFTNAALHDGAMVIRDGRIAAAGCVLPLSKNHRISADLGTRHRAGLGISEVTDAVVVIVSEETGTISVAAGGMLKRHLAPQTLSRLLTNELAPEEEPKRNLLSCLKGRKDRKGGNNEE